MEQTNPCCLQDSFYSSFLLAGIVVWEKLANLMGYTFMRTYDPWRVLEVAQLLYFS